MSFFKSDPISGMKDAYCVAGKNVVVTGGNRGMGRGIVHAFAEAGANVAILEIERNDIVVSEIEPFGGKNAVFQCDVSDIDSVKVAVAEVFRFFDHVDVIVNNAGIVSKVPFFSENGISEWHRVFNVNLHGPANIIHEFAPKMISAGKGGTIINISSTAGQRVSGSKEMDKASYNVSKAAVDIFSRYLAVVLGDHGIRVNTIVPGPTNTDLAKALPPGEKESKEKLLPGHRFIEPAEIGALCVYMASPAGAMVTGVNWAIDAGMLCVI